MEYFVVDNNVDFNLPINDIKPHYHDNLISLFLCECNPQHEHERNCQLVHDGVA